MESTRTVSGSFPRTRDTVWGSRLFQRSSRMASWRRMTVFIDPVLTRRRTFLDSPDWVSTVASSHGVPSGSKVPLKVFTIVSSL